MVPMSRDFAIDYLRSSVTVSVVAHHSALAYNTFSRYDAADYTRSSAPVVDSVSFVPLDILVGWNDLFFMALMFIISGFFVGPSLDRKGPGRFLADRAKRLGIPFVFSAAVLSPIAYYPSWRLSDSVGGGHFLSRFFTVHGWQTGPAWFIWVLLAFCLIAAMAWAAAPGAMERLSWRPRTGRGLVLALLVITLSTILPTCHFVREEWVHLGGPFLLPAQRAPLYLALFVFGIAIGKAGLEVSLSRQVLRWWPGWLVVGFLAYGAHGTLTAGNYLAVTAPWFVPTLLSVAYALCCTFTSIGALGFARAVFVRSRPIADLFSESAYGVYIFHYGLVTWVQLWLLACPIPAAAKFLTTFILALGGSWLITALLRKTPAKDIL